MYIKIVNKFFIVDSKRINQNRSCTKIPSKTPINESITTPSNMTPGINRKKALEAQKFVSLFDDSDDGNEKVQKSESITSIPESCIYYNYQYCQIVPRKRLTIIPL